MPNFEITIGENILKEEEEGEKVIKFLKNRKATGPDEISTKELKLLEEGSIESHKHL